MAFKFYLDGQLTDQPMNDTQLSTSIKRDRQLNNLLVSQDVELEYNGNNEPPIGTISGYNYLQNLFFNSACNESSVEIYDQLIDGSYVLYYSGIIKIPSVKIDLQKAVLKTKIQDNSFYSYINNNKTLEVDLSADLTKSQFPLNPIVKYSLDLYNQVNCDYGSSLANPAYYEAYLVYDVFDLLVRAISDNKVSFESEFLNNLENKPFLCKGQDLLNSYTLYPNAQEVVIKLTFEKLFNEMKKLYNVFFWIDTTDLNNPVLKLESFDGSYDFAVAYDFQDIKELNVSIDSLSLASKVNVGSSAVTSGLFDNSTSYYGWTQEEFFPLGQCNIDNELDLVNDFIIDTNSIQDIMIGQSTDLIDNIFIIECDNVDSINKTAIGVQYDIFNNGDCFYNEGLNNFNKVQRYSNQFVTTFGNFNGLGGYDFKASIGNIIPFSDNSSFGNPVIPTYYDYTTVNNSLNILFTPYTPVIFTNETTNGNFDNGGYYNNTNGKYTIPVDGIYNFVFSATYLVLNCRNASFNLSNNRFKLKFTVELYDSANNLKTSQSFPQYTTWFSYSRFSGQYTDNITFLVNAVATDYVICRWDVACLKNTNTLYPNEIPILNVLESYFTVISTPTGQGGGGSGNNNANKYLYEFDYEIPQSDFINLLQNVTNQIIFEKDGITRFGWIESIKRNDWTGISQIKLITRNAATSQ